MEQNSFRIKFQCFKKGKKRYSTNINIEVSCPGPGVPLEATAPWHFRVPCPHCQRSAPCRRSGLLSRRKWPSHHLPVVCFKETQIAAPLNCFSCLARQPPCTQVTGKQGQHPCPGPSSDLCAVFTQPGGLAPSGRESALAKRAKVCRERNSPWTCFS